MTKYLFVHVSGKNCWKQRTPAISHLRRKPMLALLYVMYIYSPHASLSLIAKAASDSEYNRGVFDVIHEMDFVITT